jgi:hypothetical protein
LKQKERGAKAREIAERKFRDEENLHRGAAAAINSEQ